MSVEARKFRLIEWLTSLRDMASLEHVEQIRKAQQADMQRIVGTHPGGKPITKAELLASVEQAEREIDAGLLISLEDLDKESENW